MPPTSNSKKPWYSEGLQFTCSGCGDCCTGDPGYVWLNKQEIADMAAALEISVEAFEAQFVRNVGIRKSLKELPESFDCVLLDADRKCRVYATRPRQCRTWPFWDSTLKSPKAWAETCDICPGSGKGRLYTLEEIETDRKVVRV